MLKRNLIAIAIVTLGLVMTINTFGQDRTPVSKKDKPKRSDLIKPIHAEVNEVLLDGTKVYGNEVTITGGKKGSSETSRTAKPKTENKLGNFEIQGIKSPRDVSSGQIFDVSTGEILWVKGNKSPRESSDSKSTQRTKQPSQEKLGNFEIQDVKSRKPANLGDTGTHEVGHKQHKRGKN